ncbi:uncharacterized protein [Erythrolamprus reginae]|uniref:uncharacterized protein isoform X1 n=1 Tax=Erythrolamprus reginae TaxID=121349 RepID=UPI00396C4CA6
MEFARMGESSLSTMKQNLLAGLIQAVAILSRVGTFPGQICPKAGKWTPPQRELLFSSKNFGILNNTTSTYEIFNENRQGLFTRKIGKGKISPKKRKLLQKY